MRSLSTYCRTLFYLKPSQIFWQIYYRCMPTIISKRCDNLDFSLPQRWQAPIVKKQLQITPRSATFLNQVHPLQFPKTWQDASLPRLWRYHLHYFDTLSLTLDLKARLFHERLMQTWINDNPVGVGTGWEPYPLSLRIVNWIKAFLSQKILPEKKLLQSLNLQARYLNRRVEYHILGNHLFANAKALLFAGLFFKTGESAAWFKKGLKYITRELKEQILPDGGHFERSPMYHAIILEDCLDIINLFQAYEQTVPEDWKVISQKMLYWLSAHCHPDGQILLFNDAALNMAASFSALSDYASCLGISSTQVTQDLSMVYFQDTGYARLKKGNLTLFADMANIGPAYQPGHTHADTLNFELSVGDRRFIVDTGTFGYETGETRLFERSSAAHNVVVIDRQNSSEVWKSFRVGRRARVQVLETGAQKECVVASAMHTGYQRYHQPIQVTRTWLLEDHRLQIEDTVMGHTTHQVDFYLHFHPTINIAQHENVMDVFFQTEPIGQIILDPKLTYTLASYDYSPEFGKRIPAIKIQGSARQQLPCKLVSRFVTTHALDQKPPFAAVSRGRE